MDEFVELARRAVETYVRERRVIEVAHLIPRSMEGEAGVFVSIRGKGGALRGSLGSLSPTRPNLAEEIIHSAIRACTDPRFPLIAPGELAELSYIVDVVEPPERVGDASELDPQRYGVVVVQGSRMGSELPSINGARSAEEQLFRACYRAAISDCSQPLDIYRFAVARHAG